MSSIYLTIAKELLLPIEPNDEQAIDSNIQQYFNEELHIPENDVYIFFSNKLSIWKESLILPSEIKNVIQIVYQVSQPTLSTLAGNLYESFFLRANQRLPFSFEEKLILLSYLQFITSLAQMFHFSCSKIIKTLIIIDNRLIRFSWNEIKLCLSFIDCMPKLTEEDVRSLSNKDKDTEFNLFGDSDVSESCEIVGLKAKSLGISQDFSTLLACLTQAEPFFWPYIQILHFQCIISEYYDHILSSLYEFAPRGNANRCLLSFYNDHTSTGNPFLNNAKAVSFIDINWANSRDTNIEQAHALVNILNELNNLNYASSKELSSYIRKWAFRLMKLKSRPHNTLQDFKLADINRLFSYVSRNQTFTQGIIEQRLLDYACLIKHSILSGWRSRGIGDSIYANNLSRKKLGDIDFQNHETTTIIAYEIHAGSLSQNYLDGHIQSLSRILELKRDELEAIDSLDNWHINVTYIAHNLNELSDFSIQWESTTIRYNLFTFNDFLGDIVDHNVELFNNIFTEVINSNRTPEYVRATISNILH